MVAILLHALPGVPHIEPGDDLANIVTDAVTRNAVALEDGDVVVLAQKIVSKSEDRYVDLSTIEPSFEAKRLAGICGKDPRLVELILAESVTVLRCVPGVIIVRHRLGLVLANAGIDQSNLPGNAAGGRALLLPLDPDASAHRLQQALVERSGGDAASRSSIVLGARLAKWHDRNLIGASGSRPSAICAAPVISMGETLQSTLLVPAMNLRQHPGDGTGNEGTPIVLVKGLAVPPQSGNARCLVRPLSEDLFQ